MFNRFKQPKEKDIDYSKIKVPHKSDKLRESTEGKSFLNQQIKKKKEVVNKKDFLTREELVKELEKQIRARKYAEHNPFKTKEDFFITFFNANMEVKRRSVPFEEIDIDGRSFLINKEFRNGEIIIKELYPYPQLEINLEEEWANKESTKKQLQKINEHLLYIKNQISKGEEKYKLLDIEDLKEEKIELEKRLDSIKYGKSAIFHYQDPNNMKQHLWMKNQNGEYRFLKVTENNYIVDENNVRLIKGNQVIRRVQEITNLRKNLNLKGLLLSLAIFVMLCILSFGLFKLVTFEEELFDKRVQDGLATYVEPMKNEVNYLRNELKTTQISCGITPTNGKVPIFDQPQ